MLTNLTISKYAKEIISDKLVSITFWKIIHSRMRIFRKKFH